MKIRIFEALDLDRKIMSIKHLREATGLGLRESKDIVDQLFISKNTIGIEVYVKDSFDDDDWDAFSEWFVWEPVDGAVTPKEKDTLKLFRVIVTDAGRSYMSVVLSKIKERAINEADDAIRQLYKISLSENRTVTCEEITSFKNGQVLLTSQL